jgi:hypothetical protein
VPKYEEGPLAVHPKLAAVTTRRLSAPHWYHVAVMASETFIFRTNTVDLRALRSLR